MLLVGRASTGRTALALSSVNAAIRAGETCLLLSPRDASALNAAGKAAELDLAALHRTGRLRVLRIPSAQSLAAKGNAGLESAYRDLSGLAAKSNATRVVIEDFTPLVQFSSFDAFGEAFDTLRESIGGAALIIGLGEPANEASQALIQEVQARVDGTVHVSMDAGVPRVEFDGAEMEPEETSDFLAPEDPSPPGDFPDPDPVPLSEFEPDTDPPGPAPALVSPLVNPDLASEPPSDPALPDYDPESEISTSDGASVAIEEPSSYDLGPPDDPPAPAAFDPPAPDSFDPPALASFEPPTLDSFEPPAPASFDPPAPDSFDPPAPEPLDPPAPQGLQRASIEPAAAPDPDLLAPSMDPFGRDPGEAFFENGYLVDSQGGTSRAAPAAAIPAAAPPAEPPPPTGAPAAPSFSPESIPVTPPSSLPAAPPTSTTAPTFAPVGAPPPLDDPGPIQTALQNAFAGRAQAAPFLVIAARMERSQPESAAFHAVADSLRRAVPPGGTFYADVSRLRSLLVLPGARADQAPAIFAALQQNLQAALGAQADSTLRAVAAITVPDGQPFGTAQELWNYAVAS